MLGDMSNFMGVTLLIGFASRRSEMIVFKFRLAHYGSHPIITALGIRKIVKLNSHLNFNIFCKSNST